MILGVITDGGLLISVLSKPPVTVLSVVVKDEEPGDRIGLP